MRVSLKKNLDWVIKMRAHVIFDNTSSYSFKIEDYIITQNKNYLLFSRKYSNFANEYIWIKWIGGKLYHAHTICHKDDWDFETLPFEEIKEFTIKG